MTIGASLLLIALGAILRWGVTTSLAGVSLATIGLILMIAGAAGLVFGLVQMATAARAGEPRDTAV